MRSLITRTLACALALLPLPAVADPVTFGDWRADSPGTIHRITVQDLPPSYGTRSASNAPSVAPIPPGAVPHVPPGFTVSQFAAGLENNRLIRVAPNGDVFVAESAPGRIRVLRAADGATRPQRTETYVSGLTLPFGIAFYPAGPDPEWLYVAEVDKVVRYPYRKGDLRPAGGAQTIVPHLPAYGDHVTRDIQFSRDGRHMYVSVGSASNVAQGLPRRDAAQVAAFETEHGRGAAWGPETERADVLQFTPDGAPEPVFATGLRNCVGMAIQPQTGDLWCSTNERDGLGDNLPPDYVTRVRQGGFFGWPWYYIGDHEDPRHRGGRPDLAETITVPDVLIQPHSAPLQMSFYPLGASGPAAFPPEYRGDAFVALHGSWNRAIRTGYKIVRLHLENGVPTDSYEDFVTGFVIDNDGVWGRPVGVAVAHDGALLVSEDGNGTIWRVAPSAHP